MVRGLMSLVRATVSKTERKNVCPNVIFKNKISSYRSGSDQENRQSLSHSLTVL